MTRARRLRMRMVAAMQRGGQARGAGSSDAGMAGLPSRLSAWPAQLRAGDLRAAWVSAVVMLPQAVAFAVVAGLSPEAGIYASVLPVIVAALLGASPLLLSGPNTAVAVMIGASLLPLAAPGGADYVELAASLTAMVGLTQLLAAFTGAGRLLALLPPFVCSGLTTGIGLVMITSQMSPAAGMLAVPDAAPWLAAWMSLGSLASANPCALAVAMAAIASAALAGRWQLRGLPPLVAAMVGGTLVAMLLDALLGSATTAIDRVGRLHVLLLPWAVPSLAWDQWYVVKQLVHSAVAISVVGGLQTVIISRSLPAATRRGRDPAREVFAQGAANLTAALTGGFAGSGSFNRTAVHVKAGAETPAAAVACSILLLLLAWLAGPLFAWLAVPAVAGTIALVGWGMLRSGVAAIRGDPPFARAASAAIVVATLSSGVEAGLWLVLALGILSIVLEQHSQQREGRDAAR